MNKKYQLIVRRFNTIVAASSIIAMLALRLSQQYFPFGDVIGNVG